MAVITVSEVKTLNQISGSAYDATIAALIPLISNYVSNYVRLTEEQIESYPGIKLAAAQMVKYQLSSVVTNVSSETIGDYSVSYTGEYPKHLTQILDNYRQPKSISDTYAYGELYDNGNFGAFWKS